MTTGKIADLKEQFPDEADRILSASFLEELLTNTLEDVVVHRHGVRIKNAVVTGPIDLENAEVLHETWLDNCWFKDDVNLSKSIFHNTLSFEGSTFNKKVDFRFTDIAGDFVADEVQFTNTEQRANFRAMKVGGDADFIKAVFAGSVKFTGADIAGTLSAIEAQFTNTEQEADFRDVKVGGDADFIKAVFAGSVSFFLSDIAGTLSASGAQFTNAEREADFAAMKVGGFASFREAIFAGGAQFSFTDIAGILIASETQFTNTEREADFTAMKVGGDASFSEAIFAGGAQFSFTDIAGILIASEAQFTNAKREADFTAMKVGGDASFHGTDLKGPVVFASAHIAGHFSSGEARFEQRADFRDMKVGGTVFFGKTVFSDSILLGGMTYREFYASTYRELIGFVNQSTYSPDVYANLEASFKQLGHPELADNVFLAQKRRERNEILRGPKWLGSLLLDVLVSYGISPERAFIWSAIIVLIGWFLFRRKEGMELQKKLEDAPRRDYNAFWYSLDLFIPFIDLQSASVWLPKQDRWFARHYMHVHRILGWVLIPIGLAALTGLIK